MSRSTAQNLLNPVDLLRTVPGVSVVDRGVRNAGTMNNVRIRGVNSDAATLGDYVPAGATAVSSYVNDTPIFANFLLNDIDRVEVLRGPQGTLYGRGSMGGTVRYILRDPVIGQTSGNVDVGLSSTNGSGGTNWNFDGTINLPLGETLALRANYSHVDNAGVVDYPNLYVLDANGIPVAPKGLLNQTTQYTSKKDADWSKIDYGRVALNWKPSSSPDWVLNVVGQNDATGGRTQITPPGTPNYAVGGGLRQVRTGRRDARTLGSPGVAGEPRGHLRPGVRIADFRALPTPITRAPASTTTRACTPRAFRSCTTFTRG